MPTDPNIIQIDSDNIEGVTSALNKVAEQLDEKTREAEEIAEKMIEELHINGSVPPIYEDIAEAIRATARRMKLVNTEVTSMLRADAKTLLNQLEQQTDVQESGAAAVSNVDTNLSL